MTNANLTLSFSTHKRYKISAEWRGGIGTIYNRTCFLRREKNLLPNTATHQHNVQGLLEGTARDDIDGVVIHCVSRPQLEGVPKVQTVKGGKMKVRVSWKVRCCFCVWSGGVAMWQCGNVVVRWCDGAEM